MWTALIGLLAAAGLASTPYWLPRLVTGLRMRLFTLVNGDEGIMLPGNGIDADGFRRVYGHPAADGRSRGAALSDLFWYWLSPGPELHQEHLEPGPRYQEVARATREILAMPTATAQRLTTESAATVLSEQPDRAVTRVRLRDLMMPVWAEFYYRVVFGEPCPRYARDLIVANADDVVTALKCCSLRHLDRRSALTGFLVAKVAARRVPHRLPAGLSTQEQALYLQGVFFNTAVVQMSEAMTHLLLVVAHHPEVAAGLADPERLADDRYLDRLVDETLRLYPLFGVAHRITSSEIPVDGHTTLPAGAVVCFNYPDYHRAGFTDPDRFDPDRWLRPVRDAHHIPFGVPTNRPCPAWRLAPITMRVVLRETVRRFGLHSSARHTRSVPNRGPCLLVRRPAAGPVRSLRARLVAMRLVDRWEDVWRSLVQLVLGTYMVWHARRLRLCQRYFGQARSTEVPA